MAILCAAFISSLQQWSNCSTALSCTIEYAQVHATLSMMVTQVGLTLDSLDTVYSPPNLHGPVLVYFINLSHMSWLWVMLATTMLQQP
jgi:hypothetical protein